LSAESIDAAGNISHQSEELVVTVDRTAPAATVPSLAATSDTGLAGDRITSISQPAIVGRAEANAKVRVYAGGVLVGEGLAGSDESDGQLGDGLGLWEITVEPLADGTYQITTEVEDLAGNVSAPLEVPLVITIDTISPQRPTMDLVTPHDTGASNLDNVTRQLNDVDFTVTADAGTTVHVKDGNTILVTYVSTGVDTVSLTLAEGTHLLSAESIDAAGNISHQSEELVVTIDRTAPPATAPALAATSDTGLAGDHLTSITVSPFLTTTREPGSAVMVSGTSFARFVTSSRSEEPVSSTPNRSIVGRCGESVSMTMLRAAESGLMLPARSSTSVVIW